MAQSTNVIVSTCEYEYLKSLAIHLWYTDNCQNTDQLKVIEQDENRRKGKLSLFLQLPWAYQLESMSSSRFLP